MSLRSSLTKVSSMRFRMTWATVVAVVGLTGVTTSGCGCDGNSTLQCDSKGLNCQICDGYGCRPADPNSGAGGAGGATTSSSSSGRGTGGSGTGGNGTGGTAPCDASQATCACTDGQCPSGSGTECVGGLCVPTGSGCNYTYQCGAGKVCDNGACVPGCSSTSPCPAGYTCSNGACGLDPQNPQCSAANPCPSGEICGPNGLCTDHCTATSQCAAGEVCDGTSQTCVSNPVPTPLCSTAKPCPAPEICEADGFCHYPCTTLAQCQLYDNRFVACDQGICKTQEEVDPQCTLTMPCPAGQSCISNTCF